MGCIGPSIVVLQLGSLYKLSRYGITITLHNLQVPGRDFKNQFQRDKPQQTVSTNTPGVDPTPPGRLNSTFVSRSGIKRNQIKVAGGFFSPTIDPSASEGKTK